MPKVAIRNPNGVYVLNAWNSNTGAGTEVAVVTDANETSYMFPGAATDPLLYAFEDITDAPANMRVTSAVVSFRVNGSAGGDSSATWMGIVNGVPIDNGGAGFAPGLATHDSTWSAYITTVGLWNSAVFGMRENWIVGGSPLVKLFATVTYEMPAGGFAALITGWLGPLVGIGLHEMERLAAEVWRRSGGTIILPHEQRLAWHELQTARWAHCFDLGRR